MAGSEQQAAPVKESDLHQQQAGQEQGQQQQRQQTAALCASRRLERWLVAAAVVAGVTFAAANDFRVATFDIRGLAGAFIDLDQPLTGEPASTQNANRGYTMTSIIRKLPTQTSRKLGDEGIMGEGEGGHAVAASLTFFAALLCTMCLAAPAASVVLALSAAAVKWRGCGGCGQSGGRSCGEALRAMLDTALAWCGLDVLSLACVAGWWQVSGD